MVDSKKAVFKTLLYSDIFDFPLTYKELWRFFIHDSLLRKEEFDATLSLMVQTKIVLKKEGFYCLFDRASLIAKRASMKLYAEKKLHKAKHVAKYIAMIPSVIFVGVSGNVAASNADKLDDIDFFIITKKGTLWITRLFAILVLEILGVRRRRNQQQIADTICVNMLVDEKGIAFSPDRQDLFTAYEVVLLKPLFEKNNSYHKFIKANAWVGKFMPNAIDTKILRYKDIKKKNKLRYLTTQLLFPLEFCAKILQLWLINKHKTTETISDSILAFHPIDYRKLTLRRFSERLKKYEAL